MSLIRLPLEGTTNTRDLGGYPCKGGYMFKWKKVYRSDCLSSLTEEDKKILMYNYGLKLVIDLRSTEEVEKYPSNFENDEHVKYVNISLAGNANEDYDMSNSSNDFLKHFYEYLLEERKEYIKKVFDEMLRLQNNEAVLFNCSHGKDRTGIISMLLHGVCGVSKQDITTNYMQTNTNIKYSERFIENINHLIHKYGVKSHDDIINSNVENIEYAYDLIISKYESFENYFSDIGFTSEEVDQFKKKFTEKH